MRIAYASMQDPHSLQPWSGIIYTMARALEANGAEVHYLGPLDTPNSLAYRIARRGIHLLSGKYLHYRFEPRVLKSYADQVARALRGVRADAVLSPGVLPITELKIDLPVFGWTDSTFGSAAILEDFRNALPRSRRNGDRAFRLVADRATHLFFSSEWAAASAIGDYGADPGRVSVVPLGANFSGHFTEPDADEVFDAIEQRKDDVCRLLFVGVRWRGKGGPKAVAIAEALAARGIRVELHVVGSEPDVPVPDFVVRHGFLRKGDAEQAARLRQLYLKSHFFVLPTTDDCFGVVFAEASAFGVPCFATDVGGVPSAVRDGKNGFAFSLDSPADHYAAKMAELLVDRKLYRAAACSARQEFVGRLNWRTCGAQVMDVIRKAVGQASRR
jgi:glycosyltransferase involved in cell wall biosynthesis